VQRICTNPTVNLFAIPQFLPEFGDINPTFYYLIADLA